MRHTFDIKHFLLFAPFYSDRHSQMASKLRVCHKLKKSSTKFKLIFMPNNGQLLLNARMYVRVSYECEKL